MLKSKRSRNSEAEVMAKMLSSVNNDSSGGDIYGDGDQSPLKGVAAQKLREHWHTGMGFDPSNLSDFFRACFFGDKPYVEKKLNKTLEKYKLMEKRETLGRLNALICIVLGAKMSSQPIDKKLAYTVDRMGTLQLLIREGANIHAKDIAGYSVLFHCFTALGDFKERRELALELMKAGADINMQNRFGCTPAHENILIQNYENLNFLVEHGADPSIEDNDGISMRSLVGFFPEALTIFSKAGFLEAKEKRQQAKSEREIIKCHSCGKSDAKKRCAKCRAAFYCGLKCQKKNWKSHRESCNENDKGKAEVEMKELEERGIPTIINLQSSSTPKGKRNPGIYEEGSFFKVKVQVGVFDSVKSPLFVSDKTRTFQRTIEPTDRSYEKIVKKIREEGVMKVKGYFYASIEKSGKFKLQIDQMLLPEKW